ncbi:MAG TPA: hypothetical protein VF023_09535 [Bryobacteraceae bacterium]
MKSSLTILCALHLIGDALILWLGYAWLSIPESNTTHLLWSLFVVLLFACSALWLHGTALAYFSGTESTFRRSGAAALRHLPALVVLAIVALVVYWLVNLVNGALGNPAFSLASSLTMTFRKPVSPPSVLAVFHAIIWLIEWLVLPALFAPVAAAVAINGFSGFRKFAVRPRLWRSLAIFVLVLCVLRLPMKLLEWIPAMPNFGAEMASFLVRGGIAYLLFAGFLLVLERVISSGMPSFTHRNNTAVP